MRPAFSESSRRTKSVAARWFGVSPVISAVRLIHCFTRCSKGATSRTRSACGTPRSSHCPPPRMRTASSFSANSNCVVCSTVIWWRVSVSKRSNSVGLDSSRCDSFSSASPYRRAASSRSS